jgi:hypothetical protein
MRSPDDKPDLPHFLRVVRSIANVRGPAVTVAAAFTTVVAGVHCGSIGTDSPAFIPGTGGVSTTTSTTGVLGTIVMSGAGGAGTTTTTSTELGIGTMTTTTTLVMGVTIMPDDAGADASDAGKHFGVVIMPDGGDGG